MRMEGVSGSYPSVTRRHGIEGICHREVSHAVRVCHARVLHVTMRQECEVFVVGEIHICYKASVSRTEGTESVHVRMRKECEVSVVGEIHICYNVSVSRTEGTESVCC